MFPGFDQNMLLAGGGGGAITLVVTAGTATADNTGGSPITFSALDMPAPSSTRHVLGIFGGDGTSQATVSDMTHGGVSQTFGGADAAQYQPTAAYIVKDTDGTSEDLGATHGATGTRCMAQFLCISGADTLTMVAEDMTAGLDNVTSVTLPSISYEVGDLVVISAGNGANSQSTWTWPTDFTETASLFADASANLGTAYKVMTTTGSEAFTVSHDTVERTGASVYVLRPS